MKMHPLKSTVILTIALLILFHGVSHTYSMSKEDRYKSNVKITKNDNLGFISIDCGATAPNSSDHQSDDAAFIDTGVNRQVSPAFLFKDRQYLFYNTLRSFPDGERNCYTLKPLNGRDHNYLIRAHFFYGDYDDQHKPPIFDVYIGTTFWRNVSFSKLHTGIFHEIVHKPITESIYVCLVNTGQGTPLISALFLRPLSSSIYNSTSGLLDMSYRYNAGTVGSTHDGYTSYPDDIYDRQWRPLFPSFGSTWEVFKTNKDLRSVKNDAYEVPLSILRRGASPYAGHSSLNYTSGGDYIALGSVFNVYWHFADTQKLGANESREFNIFASGNFQSGPITLRYMEPITVAASITIGPADSQFTFSIKQTNASPFPPILNALEIYTVMEPVGSTTDQDDVNAIMDIRRNYKQLSGWNADPCLPVAPWNGLNCSNTDSPRITSLNLASRGLTGEILPSLSSLTSLAYLNLSNNQLTGTIPEYLAKMPLLVVIDLSNNNLSGSVPVSLMLKAKSGLHVDGNPYLCVSNACTKKSRKHTFWALLVPISLLLLLIALAVPCLWKWKRNRAVLVNTTAQRQSTLGVDKGMEPKNRKFTYSEVINMTNNLEKEIGKGGSGTVYSGVLEDGTTKVAVKILNGSSVFNIHSFRTEAELLMRVHHRNLVSLIGYCDEGTHMALIFEYMANGNLREHLSGKHPNTLTWRERLQISIDTAEGLEYLHGGCKPSIIHRDLKTANILLDHRLRAKLADFGLSRIFETESASHISTSHMAGTIGYLDPECHESYKLTEKGDVYSFGVVLLELITGQGAISRNEKGSSVHVIDWVEPQLQTGDIHYVVDPKLEGNFSLGSAWKALETAMACVATKGNDRPIMDQVLFDLKECFANERSGDGAHVGSASAIRALDIVYDDSEFSGPSAR